MAETQIVNPEQKVIINHMPVIIRSVDRSFKDIAAWWNALQQAESVYYANRADLYDIFATVALDGHLSGIIDKRIRNVTNKKLVFKKNNKKVDALDALINSEKFKELRKERFSLVTHGIYGFEFIPGKTFDFKVIPIKHINPVMGMVTKEEWGTEGFKYDDVWNIMVKGKPGDFGLLNVCAPYAIWKKGNFADWAQYIEDFGSPMVIFTYDAYNEETRKELDNILKNFGNSTRIMIPKSVTPEVKDGKTSNGNGELQDKFRNACNMEMSVKVLGVTETTTASKSSGYAQSETHLKQQGEVEHDDQDDELNFFNNPKWLAIQKSYGFTDDGQYCYEDEVDLDKVKKQVDIIMTVSKRQPVDDDYVYETTGIPKPKNYDALKAQMEEDRKAALHNANNNPANTDPKKDKKPEKKTKLNAQLDDMTWLQKLRAKLADFFDQAPKD